MTRTNRGFQIIEDQDGLEGEGRLIQASSRIGDYEDAFDNPGSSYLWVGEYHLNREQVQELASIMIRWVETGDMEMTEE